MPNLKLAGSAIGQNAGLLKEFENWKPPGPKALWLLLAGATAPPKNIWISSRRNSTEGGGSFLHGVSHDLTNMEGAAVVKNNLHNVVRNFSLTKEDAKWVIQKLFRECMVRKEQPVVYYTGHGEIGTGNWCFANGTLSLHEIEDLLEGCSYPLIISDSCYSGHWANLCINRTLPKTNCLAACPKYSAARDTGG